MNVKRIKSWMSHSKLTQVVNATISPISIRQGETFTTPSQRGIRCINSAVTSVIKINHAVGIDLERWAFFFQKFYSKYDRVQLLLTTRCPFRYESFHANSPKVFATHVWDFRLKITLKIRLFTQLNQIRIKRVELSPNISKSWLIFRVIFSR